MGWLAHVVHEFEPMVGAHRNPPVRVAGVAAALLILEKRLDKADHCRYRRADGWLS
jgi:hypothetical protein